MSIYHLTRVQVLPVGIEQAWKFFSEPNNLIRITPPEMGLRPVYMSHGDEAYEGQIIRYRIRVLPGITVNWVTEITHVKPPHYFVDDQRLGPYAMWHHQHHFKSVDGGVEMIDEVSYAIPLGMLGRLAHAMFVKRKVEAVFDHRFRILEQYFNKLP